jgi:hypothetical protein
MKNNKYNYTKKGFIIGGIIGLFHSFWIFLIQNTEIILLKLIDKEYQLFCKIFQLNIGEQCGFYYATYGTFLFILLYGVLGGLIGFVFQKLRK